MIYTFAVHDYIEVEDKNVTSEIMKVAKELQSFGFDYCVYGLS